MMEYMDGILVGVLIVAAVIYLVVRLIHNRRHPTGCCSAQCPGGDLTACHRGDSKNDSTEKPD